MPELPEVETVRRGLAVALPGKRIVLSQWRRPDLRFPLPEGFSGALEGRCVNHVERRAKYLMITLGGKNDDKDDLLIWLVHFGMSGRFSIHTPDVGVVRPGYFVLDTDGMGSLNDTAGPHDHGLIVFNDGTQLIYTDPRRFGFMDLFSDKDKSGNRHLARLGMEPFSKQFSGESLASVMAGRRLSLKAALLDQRLIAGLGNIYACESLFRARLSPHRQAGSLMGRGSKPSVRAHRLAAAIQAILGEAITAGGSSLKDYEHPDGTAGWFQHGFSVYGRSGATCLTPNCAGRIKRIVQNSRSTFYCSICQR
ncbi:MAG: bifunctional DNA-formamidopyrimidine glycosylase/DNA-(apurinic or apyrimidinic site) lyase [Parvularculales bacterium]